MLATSTGADGDETWRRLVLEGLVRSGLLCEVTPLNGGSQTRRDVRADMEARAIALGLPFESLPYQFTRGGSARWSRGKRYWVFTSPGLRLGRWIDRRKAKRLARKQPRRAA